METMTKQEVASALGVTPRTVESYVKRGIKSEKPLRATARLLGVRL